MGVINNLKHAFNAIAGNKDPTVVIGRGSTRRMDRVRTISGKDKTIVSAVCTRIATDVSSRKFMHVQLDENDRYEKTLTTPLNNALTFEANMDQSGRELIFDAVYSMLDEGVIGLLPTSTDLDPRYSNSYSVYDIRVCKILEFYANAVKVRFWDDVTGEMKERTVPKKCVSIIENPFSTVMNEPNSTGQRLARKLAILDAIDEQSGSGRLDLIIQLPYSLKNPLKKEQAETRRKDIEMQLTGSKLGIAYADATEKITQLNRPIENNLMKQVEYLTNLYMSQLGITQGVLDGTATPSTMQNYQNRVIKVISSTIENAINRTFVSKTSRTQKKVVRSFFDIFELIPIEQMLNMSGALTASGILEAADIRDMMGKKAIVQTVSDTQPDENMTYDEQTPYEYTDEEEYNV